MPDNVSFQPQDSKNHRLSHRKTQLHQDFKRTCKDCSLHPQFLHQEPIIIESQESRNYCTVPAVSDWGCQHDSVNARNKLQLTTIPHQGRPSLPLSITASQSLLVFLLASCARASMVLHGTIVFGVRLLEGLLLSSLLFYHTHCQFGKLPYCICEVKDPFKLTFRNVIHYRF